MVDARTAQLTFEAENRIKVLNGDENQLYYYDTAQQSQLRAQRPWAQDPHWFQNVHISAVALIKMVMHARSGGNIEVMGMMQGKIIDHAFVIMDVYPLPVEGTETRVNASEEGYQFMVAYKEQGGRVGRKENIVGWYHSHPGYGCWLSGIDVSTQSSHQQHEDPFLAIVVDPIRTMSAGKVDIGAFRTYPNDYQPTVSSGSKQETSSATTTVNGYQVIPMNKVADFGVHYRQYYPLKISYFKSSLDTSLLEILWNKYWTKALSSTPMIQNHEYYVNQLKDIGEKVLAQCDVMDTSIGGRGRVKGGKDGGELGGRLSEVMKDVCKCSNEHSQSIMALLVRKAAFKEGKSCRPQSNGMKGKDSRNGLENDRQARTDVKMADG